MAAGGPQEERCDIPEVAGVLGAKNRNIGGPI